jgi:hypothetical protein
MKPKQSSTAQNGQFTLGRGRFEKISAVEGIKTSPMVAGLFAEFDRKRLSAEERRRVIRETFARKA